MSACCCLILRRKYHHSKGHCARSHKRGSGQVIQCQPGSGQHMPTPLLWMSTVALNIGVSILAKLLLLLMHCSYQIVLNESLVRTSGPPAGWKPKINSDKSCDPCGSLHKSSTKWLGAVLLSWTHRDSGRINSWLSINPDPSASIMSNSCTKSAWAAQHPHHLACVDFLNRSIPVVPHEAVAEVSRITNL